MTVGYQTKRLDKEKLLSMLELVTRENTAFFLSRLRAGLHVPASALEAGIKHCPDAAGDKVLFLDAQALIDTGVGSCGSIAAFSAALLRARAIMRGRPEAVAAGRYAPALEAQDAPANIDYWHCVVRTPTGLKDPSATLPKACRPPEYLR